MTINNCEIYQYTLPLMDANMFVMVLNGSALIIDPVINENADKVLRAMGVQDITIILTHEHFDHISGVNFLRDLVEPDACRVIATKECADMIKDPDKNLSRFFEAMFITRSEEERIKAMEIFDKNYSCEADITFDDSMTYTWQDLRIRMIKTPGHSPGSICTEIYDEEGALLAVATGDSLVQGNKVVTRLPGGDKTAYREYTQPYLESIPADTLILPGHGSISYMKDLELG